MVVVHEEYQAGGNLMGISLDVYICMAWLRDIIDE